MGAAGCRGRHCCPHCQALSWAPEGGRIAVATRLEGHNVEISVRDNGVGIAPQWLGSIFDTFGHVPLSPAGTGVGLGLGLSLVRQLTQLHGGTVEARSNGPGQGSEFIVRLPIAVERRTAPEEDGKDSEPPAPQGDQSAPTAAATKARHVLIVDDNKDFADSLSLMLQTAGYQVQQVYDGKSALKVTPAFAPEVVLLDIGLPDISGYDLAQVFKRKAGSPLVIAVSGFTQDKERLRSDGAIDHYLVKPVDPGALLSLLGKTKARLRQAQA